LSDTAGQPDETSALGDLSGRQFGNFQLLRKLGRGAMAEVYLAEQSALKRKVAVKILKPSLAEDETYLKRFEVEAQAAASLVHANIVQIYEVGRVDRLHYIAQEYVRGQNLHQWITRHGTPDLPQALSIMRQVAAALAKAAEQRVVHRDVKPENIMLTQSGEVKVADFGLARVVREGEALHLTRVGLTMGTPLYMSPEQVESKPLDHRSDLYSFGVTCYHMLGGAPPFRGQTALGVAVQHLKTRPEPLENVRADLPAALCRLVHRMLAKDPEERPQSAREILRELRHLHQEHFDDQWPEDLPGWEPVGTEIPTDPRLEVTRQLDGLMKTVAMRSSKHRARWAFVAAAAALFLLGGFVAWQTTKEPYLLTGAEEPPTEIHKQESALMQYLYASRSGTEQAWESVIEYYPDNKPLCDRARQELARIYVLGGEYDRALEIFDRFAAYEEPEGELRTFGLVGQYGVLTLVGEYDEAAVVLTDISPLELGLRDDPMRRLFFTALRLNKARLDERTALEWDQFFHELAPKEE